MATGDTSPTHTERLPDPVVEDLLEADRRRIALAVLADRSEPIAIDDLAGAVLARERDTTPAAVPAAERRAVRDEFFAEHLPKLTATDVVRYDSTVGTVELSTGTDIVDRLR